MYSGDDMIKNIYFAFHMVENQLSKFIILFLTCKVWNQEEKSPKYTWLICSFFYASKMQKNVIRSLF